ncbi:U-box domain-containing protein 41 [Gossypium australe]|uniref:U-box domain-containing protein 41 n=1 Tax=Gossypium australe TaxID=47621 RepID=A0A5B6UN12_9ROSI|nr:U-box domain-containing protein 41 [Gossypium australe]
MEDLVIENLFNGNRELQIQAATQLSKLGSKQRHKLAETGIISPLISMLQSQDFEAIEASLLALLGLAFGSERNKIRIVKSGIIPVLLELLQCQNEELIELSMAAMLILSSCKANKLIIASSGTIQLLVQILNLVNSDPNNVINTLFTNQAKIDAIATLQNLSTCHQIIPLISSSGIIYTLLQLIHTSEKSSDLTEKAMSLLGNIVSWSENSISETTEIPGSIRIIVEAMEEGSPQCKEHAVGILLHICQSCRDKYRGLILMEGVMPGLLQLSVDGTWGAKNMARDLLLLLRDCSDYASTSKQSKHELMEQIMQAIDADGEKVNGTTLALVQEMINKLNI